MGGSVDLVHRCTAHLAHAVGCPLRATRTRYQGPGIGYHWGRNHITHLGHVSKDQGNKLSGRTLNSPCSIAPMTGDQVSLIHA